MEFELLRMEMNMYLEEMGMLWCSMILIQVDYSQSMLDLACLAFPEE
jgi:hypothetical protein